MAAGWKYRIPLLPAIRSYRSKKTIRTTSDSSSRIYKKLLKFSIATFYLVLITLLDFALVKPESDETVTCES